MHPQRGAHGPLGVVLVGDRRAEQGHDLVADDLVEVAAEVDDVGDERLEAGVDEAFDLLGVAAGRERGEADEVGHEHGDEAALVGRGDQALTAFRAEACPFGYGRAARRTGHLLTIPVRPVWPTPGFGCFAFRSTAAVPTIEVSRGAVRWSGGSRAVRRATRRRADRRSRPCR